MFDKLVITVISPLGTVLVIGAIALALAWRGRSRLAWGLGGFAVIWLGLWSLPVVSHGLRAAVEGRYPAQTLASIPTAQAIVVLGGGVQPVERIGQAPNLLPAADRVWYAAQLFHAGKAPLVVLSGGSNPKVSATSEAQAMRQFLVDLAIPEKALLLEEGSRNTRQNAQYSAALLQPLDIRHILLVTSALHMRRSVALFEAAGFRVTPAATDHEVRHLFDWIDWLPGTEALDGSARALKEIVGHAAGR